MKFKVRVSKTLKFEIKESKRNPRNEEDLRRIVREAALKEVWPFKPDSIQITKVEKPSS